MVEMLEKFFSISHGPHTYNITIHTHLFYKKRRSFHMDFLLISSLPKQPSEYLEVYSLHRISRLLKYNPKCLRVSTTESSRKKYRTRRDNQNPSKPSWKSRNNPPKGHTKNRHFVFYKISKDSIYHILYSRVEVGFNSDG